MYALIGYSHSPYLVCSSRCVHVFTFAFSAREASAQQCQNGACAGMTIYNCTSHEFKIVFKPCCNGWQTLSQTVMVPTGLCTIPAAVVNYAPCTVIGIAAISPALPPGIQLDFDPVNCIVAIY